MHIEDVFTAWEILNLSTEKVYESLKNGTVVSDSTEWSLLERKSALVDLGLARFGRSNRVASTLFRRCETKSTDVATSNASDEQAPLPHGIRLAVLSNKLLARSSEFPRNLFPEDGELSEFIATGDIEELRALFQNPNLTEGFLCDLFKWESCFRTLDEDRWRDLIGLCSRNTLLAVNPERRESYADMERAGMLDALWRLPLSVSVNEAWADTLSSVLANAEPDCFSVKDWKPVIDRWKEPTPEQIKDKKQGYEALGYLDSLANVRFEIARFMLRNRMRDQVLGQSDDVAFRACLYRFDAIKEAEIEAAYKQEPRLSLAFLMNNETVWRDPSARSTLWECCMKDADVSCLTWYRDKEAELKARNPAWFDEGSGAPDETSLEQINDRIAVISEGVRGIKAQLNSVRWVVGLLALVILGQLLLLRC